MIRRYQGKDYEQVMGWLVKRGQKKIHPDFLSEHGLIIPEKAAVWVYMTNSDVCYIENLITNPEEVERAKWIKLLLDSSIKFARDAGFKFVLSVTNNESVIAHSVTFGAKITPGQSLITLQLK